MGIQIGWSLEGKTWIEVRTVVVLCEAMETDEYRHINVHYVVVYPFFISASLKAFTEDRLLCWAF